MKNVDYNTILVKLDLMDAESSPGDSAATMRDCPENYLHNSAKFYVTGVQGIATVTYIQELMDIDLTQSLS